MVERTHRAGKQIKKIEGLLFLLCTVWVAFFLPAPTSARASAAAAADICEIEGKIKDVRSRTIKRAPHWASNGGVSEEVAYVDVEVEVTARRVKEKLGEPNCTPIGVPQLVTYQFKGWLKPKTGRHIRALTHFEGDESYAGDFIYDIQPLL